MLNIKHDRKKNRYTPIEIHRDTKDGKKNNVHLVSAQSNDSSNNEKNMGSDRRSASLWRWYSLRGSHSPFSSSSNVRMSWVSVVMISYGRDPPDTILVFFEK
jgi:hypothetical protein